MDNILLVMGLGDDGGEGGGGPLPGQHLVLDLSNLLLQVPGGGVHGLPDAEKSVLEYCQSQPIRAQPYLG